MFGIALNYLLPPVLFPLIFVLTLYVTRSHSLSKRLLGAVGACALFGAFMTLFNPLFGGPAEFLLVAAVSYGFLALAEPSQVMQKSS